jgi:prepilin-type processing-associated H-X9-DG protein
VADRDFYATVGLLALEAGRLADKLPDLQNSLGLAVCAHRMRQIGMALHLYLLDHQGKFPPSSVKHEVKFKGKPAVVTEFYQDMLKPYLGLPAGDLIDVYGVCHTIPEDSILQCPVYPPCKVGSLCHYGYGGATAVADSEKTLKFSAIKPAVQLLLADTGSLGDIHGRGLSALRSQGQLCPRHGGYVNVLYADGHVCAADIHWLWDSMPTGAPWDSRRPRVPRTDGKPWPLPIPRAEK